MALVPRRRANPRRCVPLQASEGDSKADSLLLGAGAINLGLNSTRNEAGAVNPKVFLVFIALQAAGPFTAFFLPPPHKVQRTDGLPVKLFVDNPILVELKETAKLFFSKKVRPSRVDLDEADAADEGLERSQFLLIVPLIAQAVFSESFNSTFLTLHYTVRARALGSFLSAVVSILAGNLFGLLLDAKRFNLQQRARYAFFLVMGLQGAWWTWSIVINNEFRKTGAVYDWSDAGFGKGFGSFLAIAAGFQLNYMFLYFGASSFSSRFEERALVRSCRSRLDGRPSQVASP